MFNHDFKKNLFAREKPQNIRLRLAYIPTLVTCYKRCLVPLFLVLKEACAEEPSWGSLGSVNYMWQIGQAFALDPRYDDVYNTADTTTQEIQQFIHLPSIGL